MKTQVVYETNIDYEATYEQLLASKFSVVVDKTQKGLIWFKLKGTSTIFIVSPNSRLQVKWNNAEEKKILFKIVKNMLVPKKGQKLRLKPMGQQTFIPFPVPDGFKVFWCEEETEYVRKIRPPRSRRPRITILDLISVVVISIFGFAITRNVGDTALSTMSNQTQPSVEMIKFMIPVLPYMVLVPAVVIIIVYTAFMLKQTMQTRKLKFTPKV